MTDRMAGLGPRAASEVIGRAFADEGAQVAVIPVGSTGEDLADAISTLDATAVVRPVHTLSEFLDVLVAGEGKLVVDAGGMEAPPLDELIATCTAEALEELRAELGGRELVLVVPLGESGHCLTGLNGRLAELGRMRGADLAETISQDTRAEKWAGGIGVDPTSDHSGAFGGLGAVVMALGGRSTTGLDLCLDGYDVTRVAGRADVVVTGAALLDFHDLGGPVVKALSEVAANSQRPLIAVAGRTYVSPRELRTAGIEAAYPVLPGAGGDEPDADQLLEAARKVAVTWRW